PGCRRRMGLPWSLSIQSTVDIFLVPHSSRRTSSTASLSIGNTHGSVGGRAKPSRSRDATSCPTWNGRKPGRSHGTAICRYHTEWLVARSRYILCGVYLSLWIVCPYCLWC